MTWTISENDLPSRDADFLSTIFTIGNGRACTRGTLSEERHEAFRGVYVSGLLTMAGYGLVYPMGAPDWLPAFLRQRDAVIRPGDSRRTLDMRTGTLTRSTVATGDFGSIEIREERFASFANANVMAQRFTVSCPPLDESIDIVMGVDGDIRNHRAKYYKPGQLPNSDAYGLKLSRIERIEANEEALLVVLHSPQANKRAAVAARLRLIEGDAQVCCTDTSGGMASVAFRIRPSDQPQRIVVDKVCVLTADLPGYEEAMGHGQQLAQQFATLTYDAAREAHVEAMARFWERADIAIEGDERSQRAVRYALWSTRIAAPNDGGRSSIGAKNLTGDWYRCAVFWDMEMYQLPLLAATAPELAANHIRYRFNRLPAGRRLAAQDGYDGARFPWHSYMSGLEEPPAIGSFLYQQLHVNLAVAFGILHHHAITGDTDFLAETGLEILVELCRFWASRIDDREAVCHIRDVCGPDEVHQGVDDNAYTNLFVTYLLRRTDRMLEALGTDRGAGVEEMLERVGVTRADRERWLDLAARLHVPMIEGKKVFAQFAGFEDCVEPDQKAIAERGEGADKTNKQADTLMLFQTIPHAFDDEAMAACFAEYAPLCNQTSSLSLCSHALLAIRLGLEGDARRYFEWAAGVDLEDQYANTCHGIHGAGQGGLWLAAVGGYGGLRVRESDVAIEPRLPRHWRSMKYRFATQGQPVEVDVHPRSFTVVNRGQSPVKLTLGGQSQAIDAGQSITMQHYANWRPAALQGVILDLDGVLVSTDKFHYEAWKALADELGLPFDETVNHQLRGVSREGSLRLIYGDHPLPDEQTFSAQCARKNERYVELISRMTPEDVLPGSRELLGGLRQAGIRIAIASASRNAMTVLNRTGLVGYVDAVADGTIITASKPDPQVFYLAAQRIRCLPWDCIGIEDAPSGVESIRRAGMLAVGIGEQARAADLCVSGVDQLSLASLHALFAEREPSVNPYTERNLAKMRAEMG